MLTFSRSTGRRGASVNSTDRFEINLEARWSTFIGYLCTPEHHHTVVHIPYVTKHMPMTHIHDHEVVRQKMTGLKQPCMEQFILVQYSYG